MKKAVYAGSFDPFTFGHFSIVKEAYDFFDEIYVVLAVNSKKKPMFNRDLMVAGIQQLFYVENLDKVKVIGSEDLIVDVCGQVGAKYIIRGLRNTTDYMYEEDIAKFNMRVNPKIKTIYFRAEDESISSSAVKELYTRGKDISRFVPAIILKHLR